MAAPSIRNKTLRVDADEKLALRARLAPVPTHPVKVLPEGIICGDAGTLTALMPAATVDLLLLDPPYNLTKNFGDLRFQQRSVESYADWLAQWLERLKSLLRPEATVYICGDWHTSASIHAVASRHFKIRNRITWAREKGRGARRNWKNNSEDIWYCTVGSRYTFNVEAVKTRRRVIAPYRDGNGDPKDWKEGEKNRYRDTHPSNLWNDITVPFWSMAENTEHPTQKSEKLLARLILASTNPGDMVLDPFAGSGTTCVVAKKLGRRSLGIEQSEAYCLLAQKRLDSAEAGGRIQGYGDGVFWERNAKEPQTTAKGRRKADHGD